MSIAEDKAHVAADDGDAWGLCQMPFWQNTNPSDRPNAAAAAAYAHHGINSSNSHQQQPPPSPQQSSNSGSSVSSVAKSLLPNKKRLRLDPPTKLYFPYEPGKQVRSAIRIKNISKALVAFKFQTTAPKSCFMRPPGGILAPGETIIATVFKFVEPPEDDEYQLGQKANVKFKIMSLKMKTAGEYVPELFDEQKDRVSVEQILRVVFLDVDRPCPQMEKLKSQLAEAEAAVEVRKKPPEDAGPKIAGEGLVIDEWKERRERFLAQKQAEGIDSA